MTGMAGAAAASSGASGRASNPVAAELAAAEGLVTELVFAENRSSAARCRGIHALYLQHERRVRVRIAEMGPGEPEWAKLDPFDHACQSLVTATGVTYSRARDMVLLAVDVHDWAGPALDAMESGLMCERIAMLLCNKVRAVGAEMCEEVMAAVVEDYLNRLRSGERPSRQATSRNATKVIEKLDPEGVAERRKAAAATRGVRFYKDDDGMCGMSARLTSAAGALLAERIDAFAGKAAPGDHRTLGQRRADALVAMATGEHIVVDAGPGPGPGSGSGHGSGQGSGAGSAQGAATPVNVAPVLRPRITVIATGTGTPRLEFARTGESTMDALTRLLASAQGASFEVVDTRPGTHDRPGNATKYRISPELARRIRARDGTCRHPGCAVAAENCDVDHIIPFNHSDHSGGGLTVEANLMCLCRRHHRYKTFSGARYDYVDDGRIRIRIDGHVLSTEPTGPLARARSRITTPAPRPDDRPASRRPGSGPVSAGEAAGETSGESPGRSTVEPPRPPDDEPPPF